MSIIKQLEDRLNELEKAEEWAWKKELAAEEAYLTAQGERMDLADAIEEVREALIRAQWEGKS